MQSLSGGFIQRDKETPRPLQSPHELFDVTHAKGRLSRDKVHKQQSLTRFRIRGRHKDLQGEAVGRKTSNFVAGIQGESRLLL